jgi:hypothetical protein
MRHEKTAYERRRQGFQAFSSHLSEAAPHAVLQDLAPFRTLLKAARRLPGIIGPVPQPSRDKSLWKYAFVTFAVAK